MRLHQRSATAAAAVLAIVGWTEPRVSSHKVYARQDGAPFFELLGTTSGTVLDTDLPWAADPAFATRSFAVTAVRNDGEESFFSNIVRNDDRDHDGVTDSAEVAEGSNPDDADSDHDGLSDGDEARRGTDPLASDTDGDGISDAEEVRRGWDPLDVDR
jgi:thrombospondin type 3 repeat protein